MAKFLACFSLYFALLLAQGCLIKTDNSSQTKDVFLSGGGEKPAKTILQSYNDFEAPLVFKIDSLQLTNDALAQLNIMRKYSMITEQSRHQPEQHLPLHKIELTDRPIHDLATPTVFFYGDVLNYMSSTACGRNAHGNHSPEALLFSRKDDRLVLHLKKPNHEERRKVSFVTTVNTGGTASAKIYFWMGSDRQMRIASQEYTRGNRTNKLLRKVLYMTVNADCTDIEKPITEWDMLKK